MTLRKEHFFGLGILIIYFLTISTPAYNNKIDREIKSILSKMIYVAGDTFTMGKLASFDILMRPADSTILSPGVPRRTIVNAFYMSATEVTNREWKLFYKDKVVELGKSTAKRAFYPDTSRWLNEFRYTYNAPMAKHYYSNPKFNEFPVVGISWDQAKAYCEWKSNTLKRLLEHKGLKTEIEFRLPTEAEWEKAALNIENVAKLVKQSSYVWSEENNVLQINNLANIGPIHDINNIVLKSYADDGCLYTCKVASYPANPQGFFDLAGNVSEWTHDEAYVYAYNFENQGSEKLKSAKAVEDEIERLQRLEEAKVELREQQMSWLAHDKKVLGSKDPKICKGGSWADGIMYTQVGSRQGIPKDHSSTKIGFRIALSTEDSDIIKFMPKKHWKPGK